LFSIIYGFESLQIIIMGGASFLGQRLANVLLNLNFYELLVADIVMPHSLGQDQGIVCLNVDVSESGAAKTNKQQA
jgi:nucleoside-diphosphate-sugar epimerase